MNDLAMEKVVEHLQEWADSLEPLDSDSLEAKAEKIGRINTINLAVKQLTICDSFGILPVNRFTQIPNIGEGGQYPEIRLMNDRETEERESWVELDFPRGPVRLIGGELVISYQH